MAKKKLLFFLLQDNTQVERKWATSTMVGSLSFFLSFFLSPPLGM
jgi:hypothetical protein